MYSIRDLQNSIEVYCNINLLDSGKFLQWMWFLEATFTPHLSELHHHKMVLPDDKKVPEVQYCPCYVLCTYHLM